MRSSERGNAVIFILVALALFAALAYTFMRSAQTGQGNMTAGQTKLAAQEIINHANSVAKTIDRLRQRGCSETELSLENVYDTAYHIYPAAPTQCRVYDPAGGNLTPLKPDPAWFNDGEEVIIYFTQGDAIQDVGTTCGVGSCAELNMNIWEIKKELCDELNRQLGITFSSIPTSALWGCPYNNGTYSCGGNSVNIGFTNANLRGRKAVCYSDNSFSYVFNYVLLER